MPVRTVEVLHSGDWVPEPFRELKKGDVFRLFEGGKLFVHHPQGYSVFLAKGDAYPVKQDVIQADTFPVVLPPTEYVVQADPVLYDQQLPIMEVSAR